MDNIQILRLKELLKTYTVAASVANATRAAVDVQRAQTLLDEINALRYQLAVNAEMREIFYQQQNITGSTNANTTQQVYVSRNDIEYSYKRGIASLQSGVAISLINEGARQINITRDPVAWQQLFSQVQDGTNTGQQIPFDLPETLIFSVNQSLGLGVTGQTEGGYIFLHGSTIKADMAESSLSQIRREFLTDDNKTIYVPETQIVPIAFQFLDATAGTFASDANGASQIFSIKNERSILLTHISTTATDCLLTLQDEAKNLLIADSIEMLGIAANAVNPFTGWYELPEPHLLRRGDRFKVKIQNGSAITGNTQDVDVLNYLAFKGHTL